MTESPSNAHAPKPRTERPSAGSKAFAGCSKQYTGAACSRSLGISESYQRALAAGQRLPGPDLRTKLHELYGIAPGDWEVEPPKVADARSWKRAPRIPAGLTPAIAAVKQATNAARPVVEEIISSTRELLEQLKNDPVSSPRDRAAVMAVALGAAKLLASMTGENATEATLASSPQFRKFLIVLQEALTPFPAAAKAVIAALDKLEPEAA